MKGIKMGGALLLAAVLLVAGLLLFADRDESQSFPSAQNALPSGTAAFAELLRRDGFNVEIARSRRFSPQQGDLVIAYRTNAEGNFWLTEPSADLSQPVAKEWVEAGGHVLEVIVPLGFMELVGETESRLAMNQLQPGRDFEISVAPEFAEATGNSFEQAEAVEYNQFALDAAGDQPLVKHVIVGNGVRSIVYDGTGSLNMFVSEEQNAAMFLTLVRSLAADSARVVFFEKEFNPAERSLFSALGPWAVAGLMQAFLLLAVIGYSYSRRFGLPDERTTRQRGSREMVEAYAEILRRSKYAPHALHMVVRAAYRDARRVLRMSPHATEEEVRERLPIELAQALRHCERLTEDKAKPGHCVQAAAQLQRQLRRFHSDSRKKR